MGKYIVEGKIGVLISPDIGAGFSTWGDREMSVDGDLIDAHIAEDDVEFHHILINKYKNPYVDANVQLVWVPIGTHFMITENHGSEELLIINEKNSYIA